MSKTESWAWMGKGTWPGFSAGNNNNAGANGNGLAVDPGAYTAITWVDGNKNGMIADNDGRDNSSAGTDRVQIGGTEKTVHEIAGFSNSTMVIDGVTHTVQMGVWVFTDGTYMVRINDANIPEGVHHSAVDKLALGKWDRTEYGESHISTRDEAFVCFAAGTLIHAARGLVAVERLRVGDRVMTADHGFQPLCWVGSATVAGRGAGTPVLIAAGALGNARDLRLSRQHRVVMAGWRAELAFGAPEVLVAAQHLVNGTTIRLAPCDSVTYVHILFDRHQIVFAEGIATESFHPGAEGLRRIDEAQRREVLRLFPALLSDPAAYGRAARPSLRPHEAAVIGTGRAGLAAMQGI